MLFIEEISDVKKIFKNEIFEEYPVHGTKPTVMMVSAIEPK